MRLIFLHGANQQGKNSGEIKETWITALETGLGKSLPSDIDVVAPFYGDLLHGLSEEKATAAIRGTASTVDQEENKFLEVALTEVAASVDINDAAITEEESKGSREFLRIDNKRINAILRLIEKWSPLHGNLVLRIFKHAYTYLKEPVARGQVDAIVRPVIEEGPSIIVAHSLGTIVTFNILRQLALENGQTPVPLYVTLGSPLAVEAIKAALGPAYSRPTGVERWLNALDKKDLVTLGKPLDAQTFSTGIDNIDNINNRKADPHSITDYLENKDVAKAIGDAIDQALKGQKTAKVSKKSPATA